MANEHPFIKRCSKHVNDYEYKFHCSICNINLSCNHGGINYMRDHVGKDKHKAAKKNQTVSSSTFIFNLMFSFSFKNHYKICFIDNNVF